METKTLLTTVLTAAVAVLNAENITVGWPLYPAARKLMAQYEKTTGKTAPELKLSNNQGASPNMRGPDGKETLGYLTMAPEKPLPGMIQIPVCSKGFFLYANTGNPFLERLDKMDSERTTTSRKQQLDAIIDKLPDSYKNAYKRISVESMTEEEFNSLVGEINTEVEGIMADVNAKGAVFGRPARTTGGGSNDGKLTEEQLNAISTRTGSPKEGQPF